MIRAEYQKMQKNVKYSQNSISFTFVEVYSF